MNATNFGIYYDDADYTAPALNHGDEAEHRFFLEHKGQTWLQLNVINSHPVSTGGYPRFFDEDIITGSVNLELEKAEQIKSVSLTVLGVAAVEGLARLRFLELTEALWTRRQQEDTPGSLVGHHSWPFSVKLPREVPLRLKDKADSTIYRLPPSFSEKGWNAMLTIEYRILVHVKMGMFSPDYTLAANLFVLPRTVADPRQKVSESGPPGPDIDPEGWVELPAIKVKGRGMTPGVQDPDITCTVRISTFSIEDRLTSVVAAGNSEAGKNLAQT
ncbi:hypothetical protein GLOTRDRAFT_132008 [Gloeophyllum trabeum ATCC 11539]|uniref:Arrestin-like N-terminal domain-containing protein n=1 Tax=Gloeophyllum trabeum (strain ATCC 11539 / FP-39264 / Madison 617) TaxID=670483 RepID=S7PZQ0_GLOTA|nr:uncharacterized protein GLOTRDRAFT_132008 [Gloeophyllum trabeum ATCC 11539]EPQ52772.1 hypothetical protein GLOTRDRAFT_132008 [Gloeophyllum trabeum ATCC 11539]